MRLACVALCLFYFGPAWARPQQQQQVDPGYLRQYYSQIQANGPRSDVTPIHESEQDQGYAQPPQAKVRLWCQ